MFFNRKAAVSRPPYACFIIYIIAHTPGKFTPLDTFLNSKYYAILEYIGEFMKKTGHDRHKPLKIALKKAGYKVDKVEQGGQKTVFTVSKIQRAVKKEQ
jgi:hypothetical protein